MIFQTLARTVPGCGAYQNLKNIVIGQILAFCEPDITNIFCPFLVQIVSLCHYVLLVNWPSSNNFEVIFYNQDLLKVQNNMT